MYLIYGKMAMVPSLVSYEGSFVDKSNTKSPIWKYCISNLYLTIMANHQTLMKPQCKICHTTVTKKTSNMTTLCVHLRQNHPQLYTKLMKTSEKECSSLTSKVTNKTLVWGLDEAQ